MFDDAPEAAVRQRNWRSISCAAAILYAPQGRLRDTKSTRPLIVLARLVPHLALTDVSWHCTIPAAAPQQADGTPKPQADAVGPGDKQKGVTELIAARGTVTRGLHRSGFGATMIRHGRRFSS
jgi:hypothetical protein